jgi:hypothetical protein
MAGFFYHGFIHYFWIGTNTNTCQKEKYILFFEQDNIYQNKTYISHCIDFIFGSYCLLNHIKASGITSFFDLSWIHTDHRGLLVDIDKTGFFGVTIHTILPPLVRSYKSKKPN